MSKTTYYHKSYDIVPLSTVFGLGAIHVPRARKSWWAVQGPLGRNNLVTTGPTVGACRRAIDALYRDHFNKTPVFPAVTPEGNYYAAPTQPR